MSIIVISVLLLAIIGILSATILYFTARKFNVVENPKIEEIESLLPGANCGGCGLNGCHDFAVNCSTATSLDKLRCPSSESDVMDKVANILGLNAVATAPQIAVLRCNGNCENRPKTSKYDGPHSCSIQNSLYVGTSSCVYGCIGEGDCVQVCIFDAIKMDITSGLPIIDEHNCVACGMCVKACPRHIIELRNKGKANKRIFVSCANKDRGAIALKLCKVACIGCGKCVKECSFDAISVNDNLAYIDSERCKLCRKCVEVCPTHAITAANYPLPIKKLKEKEEIIEGGKQC